MSRITVERVSAAGERTHLFTTKPTEPQMFGYQGPDGKPVIHKVAFENGGSEATVYTQVFKGLDPDTVELDNGYYRKVADLRPDLPFHAQSIGPTGEKATLIVSLIQPEAA